MSSSSTANPSSSPEIQIPHSNNCVRVRAVDTTTRMVCDADAFVQPVIKSHKKLNFPTLCFLLERSTPSGTRYTLFDCGSRKDYWNGSPSAKKMIGNHVLGLEVDKGVDEVLKENGVDLEKLDAIIWSHWHWDHTGDASKFPPSTEVVVGPGFKESFIPGWPDNQESPILAQDLVGRRVHEIDLPLNIGGFPAHDYFGDGSLYLLDVPGHAIGHICALARTTPSTFVLLGGDCCHFPGAIRPSSSCPMPEYIQNLNIDLQLPSPCPCGIFTDIHPREKDPQKARTEPFYEISRSPGSAYTFADQAQDSINRLQVFDAHPGVFILLAHDPALFNILPLFNNQQDADINDWQAKNWKEQARWGFLNELSQGNPAAKKDLVTGLRRNGKLIVYGSDGFFHDL